MTRGECSLFDSNTSPSLAFKFISQYGQTQSGNVTNKDVPVTIGGEFVSSDVSLQIVYQKE